VRDGRWQLLEPEPAWEENPTWEQFVAFAWEADDRRLVVATNYGPVHGQCYVRLPFPGLEPATVLLHDLMDPTIRYD